MLQRGIDQNDLSGAIMIVTKPNRRDNFNVKGVFLPAEEGNFNRQIMPIIQHVQTEDNGEQIVRNLDLPFTQSSSMAQRIAKINLFKARQQLMTLPCKLTAFKYNVGDVVITLDRFGFSNGGV